MPILRNKLIDGVEMTLTDWKPRLVCSRCGSQAVDMVLTGETAVCCRITEPNRDPGLRLGPRPS
jgi:hypothetical protein